MKIRPVKDYFLFGEAWLLLAFARFVLVFFPFKKIAPMLGKAMYEVPFSSMEDKSGAQVQTGLAILRASNYSPWRTKCFEQAIAAKVMLKFRGIKSTVFFGVLKNASNEIRAHAWLKSNELIVTGGPDISMFTVISWFGS